MSIISIKNKVGQSLYGVFLLLFFYGSFIFVAFIAGCLVAKMKYEISNDLILLLCVLIASIGVFFLHMVLKHAWNSNRGQANPSD